MIGRHARNVSKDPPLGVWCRRRSGYAFREPRRRRAYRRAELPRTASSSTPSAASASRTGGCPIKSGSRESTLGVGCCSSKYLPRVLKHRGAVAETGNPNIVEIGDTTEGGNR